MFVADKLSIELSVNYMELFTKSNEYHHSSALRTVREDVRLKKVFSENEVNFLACVALEYLKQNRKGGNYVKKVNTDLHMCYSNKF